MINLLLLGTLFLAGAARAAFGIRFGDMEGEYLDPVTEYLGKVKETESFIGQGTFDQLLDHSNLELGTFKQRFWYSTKFWKGPGSPIILFNPGEDNAEPSIPLIMTNSVGALFAAAFGGAVVVMEHRYWGGSSPFDTLTVKNLQYLTVNNSIKDISYFANHLVSPFDPSGKSSPTEAPWILSGCSYAGALASWSATLDPGAIWAYHASSGVVEAVGDFWQYYVPILEATPRNCSVDVRTVVAHVDEVMMHGNHTEKLALKAKFKLSDLTDADFGAALAVPISTWQATKLGQYSPYHQFCDYVENVWPNSTNKVPGPHGVGLDQAIYGYAKWFVERFDHSCMRYGYPEWNNTHRNACLQYQNASNPGYHDLRVGNFINRQWRWMLCNEPFGWLPIGAPPGVPSLVSRLVTADYYRKQCAFFFPPERDGPIKHTYGIAKGRRPADINRWTGGWFGTNSTRLMHVNGELDPWRDVTLSSRFRRGGPVKSTEKLPVLTIPGGIHCSDLWAPSWKNPEVREIVVEEVKIMRRWVVEFYTLHNKTWPGF